MIELQSRGLYWIWLQPHGHVIINVAENEAISREMNMAWNGNIDVAWLRHYYNYCK